MASSTRRKKKLKYSRGPDRPPSERGETLLTREEAADYLGVKLRWMFSNAVRAITYTKIGGHVRFRKADLDAYIEAQRVPAGER